MKRVNYITIILTSVCILFSLTGKTQTVQVDKTTGRLYAQPYQGSLVQQLVPGKEPVKGTPLLFEDAQPATIYKEGQKFNEKNVLIDLNQEIIIFSSPKGNYFTAFSEIDSMEMGLFHFVYKNNLGLVQLIDQAGKFKGFKKVLLTFKEADYKPSFDQGTRYDEWKKNEAYYFQIEDKLIEVSRIKDFSDVLSEAKYAELSKFARLNSIKKITYQDMVTIIGFLNRV
jgi:hypothetical protein